MFRFGQNWKDYALNALDDQKLVQAKSALSALLRTTDLNGKTFLDIGCGSGLHSVSAVLLNAGPVYAIDVDPECIDVTRYTVRRFLRDENRVQVKLASILDPSISEQVDSADIVYSWGVLHHTGQMYSAIELAGKLVKPGGLYVIAIYNKHVTSPVWHAIKWTYNRVPQFIRRIMYYAFWGLIYVAKLAVTRQNPARKERGMDFSYDVIDWIGGYPYDYASISEITDFVTRQGFSVEQVVPAQVGTGCNEFVFRKVKDLSTIA